MRQARFLMFISVVAAVVLWVSGHHWLAIGIGVLFGSGLGWAVLGFIVTAIGATAMRVGTGGQSKVFIEAWEARFGEMIRGVPQTHPPAGIFQTWRAENKQSGISAKDWLDNFARMNMPYDEFLTDTEHLQHYDMVIMGTRTRAYQKPDRISYKFEVDPDHFMAHALMRQEVTMQQITAGHELWFPKDEASARQRLEQLAAHGANQGARASVDTLTSEQAGPANGPRRLDDDSYEVPVKGARAHFMKNEFGKIAVGWTGNVNAYNVDEYAEPAKIALTRFQLQRGDDPWVPRLADTLRTQASDELIAD